MWMMWWGKLGLCLMGVTFLRASGEIKFNFLNNLKIQSLSSRSPLSLCVVTLRLVMHLFYTCPNYSLSFLLISAAAKSLHKISSSVLNSDIAFMILKFSRFIMSIFLFLLSFSHFLSSAPSHFPSPTLGVSLCWSSCPSIRGMGSCASQIPVQQFPVEVSGDCHMAQVAYDYSLLMVYSIWE